MSYNDPTGLKTRICSRPLQGAPGQAGDISHEYVEIDDGSVFSFNPASGESWFGGISSNKPESGSGATCSPYSEDSKNDAIIKKRALENFKKKYNLIDYNCHDFVDDVMGRK